VVDEAEAEADAMLDEMAKLTLYRKVMSFV